MSEPEAPDFIAAYRAAFEAANGVTAPTVTNCGRGWYKVDGRSPLRRQREIVQWTNTLQKRAKAANK